MVQRYKDFTENPIITLRNKLKKNKLGLILHILLLLYKDDARSQLPIMINALVNFLTKIINARRDWSRVM